MQRESGSGISQNAVNSLNRKEFERRFERFLRSLEFENRIFLVFDADVDGVCSAVITMNAFAKIGIRFSKMTPDYFEKVDFFSMKNFEAGIVVDVPTPMQESFLRKTRKKMLVIDHHPSHDVQSKNVFYVNPRLMKKEIYQPTSYTAFKLFSGFVDLQKIKWIAIIGTVGDYGFNDVRDLYKNEVKVKRKEDIWKTNYGRAASRLNATIAVYGAKTAFEILKNCRSLSDFFGNNKIKNAHKKFSKEFWDADKNIRKTTEFYPEVGLLFAKVETKYSRITSALSTRTGTTHPNNFVILAEKNGNEYNIHGRMHNGRIHVGEVLKIFGGGGHREAGGCKIPAKDLGAFKKRLIEILRKKR